MPKVSVIVPAYNMADFIGQTLESILSQDFADFECIIIDDGSTDHTADVVKGYTDSRISYYSQENSGGPAIPRNRGLDKAVGEYIFIFDADDIMLPGKIRLSVEAMERHQNGDLLFTEFSSIDEHGALINEDYLKNYQALWSLFSDKPQVGESVLIHADAVHEAILRENFIGTSSVVLRRSALAENDRFNESLKNSDDKLFWLLFTRQHNAIFLNKNLHHYRIQPNSITNQGFIRRGWSKIAALKIVYNITPSASAKRLIRTQIKKDYISLSYAYRLKCQYRDQIKNAYESLRWGFSFKAIKLMLYGVCMLVLDGFKK